MVAIFEDLQLFGMPDLLAGYYAPFDEDQALGINLVPRYSLPPSPPGTSWRSTLRLPWDGCCEAVHVGHCWPPPLAEGPGRESRPSVGRPAPCTASVAYRLSLLVVDLASTFDRYVETLERVRRCRLSPCGREGGRRGAEAGVA